MTDTPTTAAPTTAPSSPERPSSASASVERARTDGATLQTDRGTTTIASSVVAKIAALAAQEIPGVQAMGKSLTRTFGAIRSKVPGGSTSAANTQGVSVEVGQRQAAIDIDIVAYYGQSIVETADAIRANVIERIEGMTGLEVVEVNVIVDDLYIESNGEGTNGDARVE
ncbi:MAG: Asp23/Gls24 family envelope stress response protein [Acidimicrobiales bacterium]